MGKSRKKYPRVKCEKSCKAGKKWANNKVRNYLKKVDYFPSGNSYKKIFCSYDICDYSYTFFKEWVIRNYNAHQKDLINGVDNYTNWTCADDDSTLEEELVQWEKEYLNK